MDGRTKEMKIQFLNGGLANQAFQYIFARHYELSHAGEIMFMDDSYFALNTVHNGYELEKVFGIKAHMLSDAFDKDVWEYMLSEKQKGKSIPQIILDSGESIYMVTEFEKFDSFNPFHGGVLRLIEREKFNPKIQDIPENIYYHGEWIDKNWFMRYQDEFLEEFQFPEIVDDKNKRLQEAVLKGNSLAVHIRRGDYVSLGRAYTVQECRGLIDRYVNYYSNDWIVYVFSDDIAWCRENREALGLDLFRGTVFVEGNMNGSNYRDMQLMSQCKGMIVSNSAFSYLAALLNTNKLCWLIPQKWQL